MKPLSPTPPSDPGRPEALTCNWERFVDVAQELLSLTQRHQAEIGNDYGPYSPDWSRYLALDRAGSCAVWTARTLAGTLVGYVIWITTRGLHCVDATFADADLAYLAPEWREGLRGYRFIKSAVAAVRLTKPTIVRFQTNSLYRDDKVSLLLKRLGFQHIGSVWQIWDRT